MLKNLVRRVFGPSRPIQPDQTVCYRILLCGEPQLDGHEAGLRVGKLPPCSGGQY